MVSITSEHLDGYAPRLSARVRHMDTDFPIEVRVSEGSSGSTAYGLTAEQATLLLARLERAVRTVVQV